MFVLVQVDCQIPAFGRCPNKYKPMKDFNKYQFMGKIKSAFDDENTENLFFINSRKMVFCNHNQSFLFDLILSISLLGMKWNDFTWWETSLQNALQ